MLQYFYFIYIYIQLIDTLCKEANTPHENVLIFLPENWFSVDEKDPVAYVKVEIVEGADMKPSDPNGQLGF